jgi:hypothetical protein
MSPFQARESRALVRPRACDATAGGRMVLTHMGSSVATKSNVTSSRRFLLQTVVLSKEATESCSSTSVVPSGPESGAS